jgi:ubiquinone/menaquinone biosynthesis C-methylase UbiE
MRRKNNMEPIHQKNAFGLAAKDYQKYRRSYDVELYHLLFSLIKTEKEISILDLGCGTGKSTEPLFKAADGKKISVFGVDPDTAMLEEARISAEEKKLPIIYKEGGAENLPFTEPTFDAIISGAAFHWYGNVKNLQRVKAVMKDGGIFFVFWVQYVNKREKTIGEELYEKYNWKGIPKKFRGQKYVEDLLLKSGFKNVSKATIPFTEKHTIPEIIGLLKTNSSYILLSLKDKADFVRDMTKAHEDTLGKDGFKIDKMEIRICYGFNG